jgi:signal transduction histidine kinase
VTVDEVRPDGGSLDEPRLEAEELRASRARVVAADDDLRRRIERDLHDGAQQHLVAIAVKLELARQVADSESATLKALLEEIGGDVQEALEAVRQLAWRIYPSLLLDRGLADALRAAASQATVSTGIEAKPIGRYPPDIEAAVYFCCLELLQAAAERADPGARATIRVRDERRTLLFDVIVQGTDVRQWEPRGLTSVSDRLGALGGRLNVTAEGGQGVRISGAISVDR